VVLIDIENISIAVGISLLSDLAYKLRYMLFHIHFRLQAAIFDILLTLTKKSVRNSPNVFLNFTNGGFHWKFADISFVSWDQVCKPPFLICVGVAYNFTTPKAPQDMCLGSPGSRWKPHKKFQYVPEIQGPDAALHRPRFSFQKSGCCSRVKTS